MALQIGSELTCSMGVTDMTASIAWYERVMQCTLLYRVDEIGWCELATPMAGVNIGLSQLESVVQGGGATNVFEVADIDAAKAHLDAEGVRQDGDIQHVPGLVRLITFYDPDGNAFMFSQSEKAG
ncbi:VOC family protein [Sphingopyxis sp. GW247-27LB]|jgi:predicted enzyme related to lactoylglutathione lyase|uniref:VOC family protein n=1 Tax=Sphingopyxis sp. GW247-27LB TaxID=2012632 RepID=UPI000BA5DF72|nr:VOC family protein [Sphingopyxis sp. GW247-27LB]PAL22249.1 glyoxalase [Sphingopyxis sp. GW247-27LB]